MNVDGENLKFKDFVKYDVQPGEIEVIVDFDRLMRDTRSFENDRQKL